ncbi:MAG: hypothetical protein AAGJ96_09685 [Pseudomonadota bacterium]
MEPVTKIATCSYCGTRSTLVFDSNRHELVCPACRAPLHNMRSIPRPVEHVAPKAKAKPVKRSKPPKAEREWYETPKKKKKKKKSGLKKMFDVAEDLFDLFD